MASTPQNGTGPTEEFRYAGSRLGLPEQGSGSVAGWGRRVLALFLDWLIAGLVASAVTGKPMWAGGNDYNTQLVVFFAMTAILVGLAGATIGHRVCGLRVITTRPRSATTYTAQPGLLSGALRAFLVCLVIPAVVYDRDRRGLHDQAANTVVVKR